MLMPFSGYSIMLYMTYTELFKNVIKLVLVLRCSIPLEVWVGLVD